MLLPEEEEDDDGERCSGAVSAAAEASAKLEPSSGDIIKF